MKKRVGQGETEVPRLDLEPKYSPTLEDVAGVDIARRIRGGSKGAVGGSGTEQAPKPQATTTTFNDILADIKKDSS